MLVIYMDKSQVFEDELPEDTQKAGDQRVHAAFLRRYVLEKTVCLRPERN